MVDTRNYGQRFASKHEDLQGADVEDEQPASTADLEKKIADVDSQISSSEEEEKEIKRAEKQAEDPSVKQALKARAKELKEERGNLKKQRKELKKAQKDAKKHHSKSTSGAEEGASKGPMTALVAAKAIRNIRRGGTGQELRIKSNVTSEARFVYYALKVWGDITVDPGTPNATGAPSPFHEAELPGEYVTRACYCRTGAAYGKYDQGTRSITLKKHNGSYVLYCSSLVGIFLAFYYGLNNYVPETAWFSIVDVCESSKLDWSKHYKTVPKDLSSDNPLHDRFTVVDEVEATKTSTTVDLLSALIAADNAKTTTSLGHIYVYSQSGGTHTGLLAWYRGKVWKLAADGHDCSMKEVVCGPYSNAASSTDKKRKTKLYRMAPCDVSVPPLNLVLDDVPIPVAEKEQKKALSRMPGASS